MTARSYASIFITGFLLAQSLLGFSQDNRTQYPPGLRNAYFGVNIGYINYPFPVAQPEASYNVESVLVLHTAVRITHYSMATSFRRMMG